MTRRPDGRSPTRRRAGRLAPGLALLLACAGPLAAQQAAAPLSFAAPDGTRFLLLPDPTIAQVRWAIATPADPADEPPGLEGLATAVVQASLAGTWRIGSLDPARERAATAALAKAWSDMATKPGDPQAMARIQECEREVRAASDPGAFEAALAKAPAHRPEVVAEEGVALLVLTTLPEAIGAVAELLLERREDQALRDLGAAFLKQGVARRNRFDIDPYGAMHAELLALAMPGEPAARAAARPVDALPTVEQAAAVWRATQRPERTVHVLRGPFDAASVRAVLQRIFAKSSLPAWTPPARQALRPLLSQRRSIVAGATAPRLSFGWVLPPDLDPVTTSYAVRWLGNGRDSALGRALAKAGHPGATVRAQAPWPPLPGGRGLLLVDVEDPAGVANLDAAVLQLCARGFAAAPTAAELATVREGLQREWTTVLDDPLWTVRELALQAQRWPQHAPRPTPPPPPAPAQVEAFLAAVFAGQPAIVEGRR